MNIREEFTSALGALQQQLATLRERKEGEHETGLFPGLQRPSPSAAQRDDRKRWAETRQEELKHQLIVHLAKELEIPFPHAAHVHGRLVDAYQEIGRSLQETAGGDILARLRGACLKRIYDQSAPSAWERLLVSMEKIGLRWSEPRGLPDAAPPEMREQAQTYHIAEQKELFTMAPPSYAESFINGIVPAWKLSYPERGSSLCNDVCIRAFGFALRGLLLREAIDLLEQQGEGVQADTERLLTQELGTVNELLHRGIDSIEEADQALRHITQLLEHGVVDSTWERVRPLFESFPTRSRSELSSGNS